MVAVVHHTGRHRDRGDHEYEGKQYADDESDGSEYQADVTTECERSMCSLDGRPVGAFDSTFDRADASPVPKRAVRPWCEWRRGRTLQPCLEVLR